MKNIMSGLAWPALLTLSLYIIDLNNSVDYTLLIVLLCVLGLIGFLPSTAGAWPRLPSVVLIAFSIYLLVLLANPFFSETAYVSRSIASLCAVLPLAFFTRVLAEKYRHESLRIMPTRLWLPIFVLAIYGLHQAIGIGNRAKGPFLDFNTFAALLYLAAIPLAVLCVAGNASRRGWGLLVLVCLGLATPNSKGAYVSVFIALLLTIVLVLKNKNKYRNAAAVAVIFATTFAVVTSFPGPHRDYSASADANASVSGRTMMYRATLRAYVSENIFFGTGLGSYKSVYAQYRDPKEIYSSGDQAHNDYLQALLEGGPVLFFALLLAGPAIPAYLLFRSRVVTPSRTGAEIAGFCAACLALSLHATVNFIYKTPALILLNGLYLGQAALMMSRPVLGFGIESPSPTWNFGLILKWFIGIGLIFCVFTLARDPIVHRLSERFSRSAGDDDYRKLEALHWIAPNHPEPLNNMTANRISVAKATTDGAHRSTLLRTAFGLTQEWIATDRFDIGAWLRAGEIARLDPAIAGKAASSFTSAASDYRPANFWIRNLAAQDLIDEGKTASACDTLRAGMPWSDGTRVLLVTRELFRWASAGEQACAPYATSAEMDYWRSATARFAAKPAIDFSSPH